MLLRTLRVFKDRLHHYRLIHVVLVGRAVERLNIVLVYVLQIEIHRLKQEETSILALTIHRTIAGHDEYSNSGM